MEGRQRRHSLLGLSCARRAQDRAERVTREHGGEPPASAAAATRSPAQPAATEVVYDRLEIWSPESGASFFEADAVVSIRIRSEPELGPTDRLLTYLDGKLLPGENALEHSLTNVDRGAHSVTSVIVSRDGRELIRSAPVVFHMRQPTADQSAQPGSGRPTAATHAHAAAACYAQGRLNSLATASRLPGRA